MIKSLVSFIFFIISTFALQAGSVSTNSTLRIDSVGVEKKDGKRFILHRVDEGQTLFAIARRYGRSVAEIRAANPDLKETLRYSQLVRVPIPEGTISRKQEKAIDKAIRKQEKEEKKETSSVVAKADDPAKSGIHVVEAGQTLYSLASRYGVSQDDIRKWNSLSGNNVLLGQALIVSEKAYQARTPSPKPIPSKATPVPEAHVAEQRPATEPKPERPADDDATSRTRTESDVTNRPAPTPPPTKSTVAEVDVEIPRPGNDAPMPTLGRRISDSGVAEMIEGPDDSGKYLALHRTAPIGTLVQVRNEFNNQSLWVKVVGRLPNTGINDKILIKLSSQAFSKLSPQDRRFRAEVSYIVK